MVGLMSCTHVSPTGMTLVGTNGTNVNYNASGGKNGTVAFHADSVDNATAMNQVVGMGNRLINWWGWGTIAKNLSNGVKSYTDNQTIQNADKIKGANKALEIKSSETLALEALKAK